MDNKTVMFQVEFETIVMNDGAGYNVSQSEFRAPVEGVYLLTVNTLAHDTASAGYRTYSIRVRFHHNHYPL